MKNRKPVDILLEGRVHKGPRAYKPSYQLKRMTWDFHAYDNDFSPSVPHGHSGKYKLDVYTGAVIDTTTGLIVTFLDKKEMERLLKDKRFQSLAITARQFYLDNNPGASLPDIEFTSIKYNARRNRVGKNYNQLNRFVRRNRRSVIPTISMNLRFKFKSTVKFTKS